MRPIPFGLSTLVGRLIRYGLGGYLGMRFGTEGLELVHQHAVWIGGVFLFLMMAAVVFALLRRKLRTGKDSSA
jgi:membrane protein DedA with SNARE-associated domain